MGNFNRIKLDHIIDRKKKLQKLMQLEQRMVEEDGSLRPNQNKTHRRN